MSNLNTHGVTDYDSALRFLTDDDGVVRYSKTLCYKTVVTNWGNGMILVTYYDTNIIRYYSSGAVMIRTDGYLTRTTTDRLHHLTPREVIVSGVRLDYGGMVTSPVYNGPQPVQWELVVPSRPGSGLMTQQEFAAL